MEFFSFLAKKFVLFLLLGYLGKSSSTTSTTKTFLYRYHEAWELYKATTVIYSNNPGGVISIDRKEMIYKSTYDESSTAECKRKQVSERRFVSLGVLYDSETFLYDQISNTFSTDEFILEKRIHKAKGIWSIPMSCFINGEGVCMSSTKNCAPLPNIIFANTLELQLERLASTMYETAEIVDHLQQRTAEANDIVNTNSDIVNTNSKEEVIEAILGEISRVLERGSDIVLSIEEILKERTNVLKRRLGALKTIDIRQYDDGDTSTNDATRDLITKLEALFSINNLDIVFFFTKNLKTVPLQIADCQLFLTKFSSSVSTIWNTTLENILKAIQGTSSKLLKSGFRTNLDVIIWYLYNVGTYKYVQNADSTGSTRSPIITNLIPDLVEAIFSSLSLTLLLYHHVETLQYICRILTTMSTTLASNTIINGANAAILSTTGSNSLITTTNAIIDELKKGLSVSKDVSLITGLCCVGDNCANNCVANPVITNPSISSISSTTIASNSRCCTGATDSLRMMLSSSILNSMGCLESRVGENKLLSTTLVSPLLSTIVPKTFLPLDRCYDNLLSTTSRFFSFPLTGLLKSVNFSIAKYEKGTGNNGRSSKSLNPSEYQKILQLRRVLLGRRYVDDHINIGNNNNGNNNGISPVIIPQSSTDGSNWDILTHSDPHGCYWDFQCSDSWCPHFCLKNFGETNKEKNNEYPAFLYSASALNGATAVEAKYTDRGIMSDTPSQECRYDEIDTRETVSWAMRSEGPISFNNAGVRQSDGTVGGDPVRVYGRIANSRIYPSSMSLLDDYRLALNANRITQAEFDEYSELKHQCWYTPRLKVDVMNEKAANGGVVYSVNRSMPISTMYWRSKDLECTQPETPNIGFYSYKCKAEMSVCAFNTNNNHGFDPSIGLSGFSSHSSNGTREGCEESIIAVGGIGNTPSTTSNSELINSDPNSLLNLDLLVKASNTGITISNQVNSQFTGIIHEAIENYSGIGEQSTNKNILKKTLEITEWKCGTQDHVSGTSQDASSQDHVSEENLFFISDVQTNNGFTVEFWFKFLEIFQKTIEINDQTNGRYQTIIGSLLEFSIGLVWCQNVDSCGEYLITSSGEDFTKISTAPARLVFFHKDLTMGNVVPNGGDKSFKTKTKNILLSPVFSLSLQAWSHLGVVADPRSCKVNFYQDGELIGGSSQSITHQEFLDSRENYLTAIRNLIAAHTEGAISRDGFIRIPQKSETANQGLYQSTIKIQSGSSSPEELYSPRLLFPGFHIGNIYLGDLAYYNNSINAYFGSGYLDMSRMPLLADFDVYDIRIHARALDVGSLGYYTRNERDSDSTTNESTLYPECPFIDGTASNVGNPFTAENKRLDKTWNFEKVIGEKNSTNNQLMCKKLRSVGLTDTTESGQSADRPWTGESTCNTDYTYTAHKCVNLVCPYAAEASSMGFYINSGTAGHSALVSPSQSHCNCLPNQIFGWRTDKIRLTGDGLVQSVTAYDAELNTINTLGSSTSTPLDLRSGGIVLDIIENVGKTAANQLKIVAILEVNKLIGSSSGSGVVATKLTLEIHDAKWYTVPVYRDYPLTNGPAVHAKNVYLPHQQIGHSSTKPIPVDVCTPCSITHSLGVSQFPRMNILDCACPSGFGHDARGRCVQKSTDKLAKPVVSMEGKDASLRFHSPSEKIILKFPAVPLPTVNGGNDYGNDVLQQAANGGNDYANDVLQQAEILYTVKHSTYNYADSESNKVAEPPTEIPDCGGENDQKGGLTVKRGTKYPLPGISTDDLKLSAARLTNTRIYARLCHPLFVNSDILDITYTTLGTLPKPSCEITGTEVGVPMEFQTASANGGELWNYLVESKQVENSPASRQLNNRQLNNEGSVTASWTGATASSIERQYQGKVLVILKSNFAYSAEAPSVFLNYEKNGQVHLVSEVVMTDSSGGSSSMNGFFSMDVTDFGRTSIDLFSTMEGFENSETVTCVFFVVKSPVAKVNFEFLNDSSDKKRGFSTDLKAWSYHVDRDDNGGVIINSAVTTDVTENSKGRLVPRTDSSLVHLKLEHPTVVKDLQIKDFNFKLNPTTTNTGMSKDTLKMKLKIFRESIEREINSGNAAGRGGTASGGTSEVAIRSNAKVTKTEVLPHEFGKNGITLKFPVDKLEARPRTTSLIRFSYTVFEQNHGWSQTETTSILLLVTQTGIPELSFSKTAELEGVNEHSHWWEFGSEQGGSGDEDSNINSKPTIPFEISTTQPHKVSFSMPSDAVSSFLGSSNDDASASQSPGAVVVSSQNDELLFTVFRHNQDSNPVGDLAKTISNADTSGSSIITKLKSVSTLHPILSDQQFSSLSGANALSLPVDVITYQATNVREDCSKHSLSSTSDGRTMLNIQKICVFQPDESELVLYRGDEIMVYARRRNEIVSLPKVGVVTGLKLPPVGEDVEFQSSAIISSAYRVILSASSDTVILSSSKPDIVLSNQMIGLQNLAQSDLQFTLTQDELPRKYCVERKYFSRLETTMGAGGMGMIGGTTTARRLLETSTSSHDSGLCLSYDSIGKDPSLHWKKVDPKVEGTTEGIITIPLNDRNNPKSEENFSLQLTIFSTVQKPGYLLSYPRIAGPTVVMIKEKTPTPVILKIKDSNLYVVFSPELHYSREYMMRSLTVSGKASGKASSTDTSIISSREHVALVFSLLAEEKMKSTSILDDLKNPAWLRSTQTTVDASTLGHLIETTSKYRDGVKHVVGFGTKEESLRRATLDKNSNTLVSASKEQLETNCNNFPDSLCSLCFRNAQSKDLGICDGIVEDTAAGGTAAGGTIAGVGSVTDTIGRSHPVSIIQSDQTFCAWTLASGYRESVPSCNVVQAGMSDFTSDLGTDSYTVQSGTDIFMEIVKESLKDTVLEIDALTVFPKRPGDPTTIPVLRAGVHTQTIAFDIVTTMFMSNVVLEWRDPLRDPLLDPLRDPGETSQSIGQLIRWRYEHSASNPKIRTRWSFNLPKRTTETCLTMLEFFVRIGDLRFRNDGSTGETLRELQETPGVGTDTDSKLTKTISLTEVLDRTIKTQTAEQFAGTQIVSQANKYVVVIQPEIEKRRSASLFSFLRQAQLPPPTCLVSKNVHTSTGRLVTMVLPEFPELVDGLVKTGSISYDVIGQYGHFDKRAKKPLESSDPTVSDPIGNLLFAITITTASVEEKNVDCSILENLSPAFKNHTAEASSFSRIEMVKQQLEKEGVVWMDLTSESAILSSSTTTGVSSGIVNLLGVNLIGLHDGKTSFSSNTSSGIYNSTTTTSKSISSSVGSSTTANALKIDNAFINSSKRKGKQKVILWSPVLGAANSAEETVDFNSNLKIPKSAQNFLHLGFRKQDHTQFILSENLATSTTSQQTVVEEGQGGSNNYYNTTDQSSQEESQQQALNNKVTDRYSLCVRAFLEKDERYVASDVAKQVHIGEDSFKLKNQIKLGLKIPMPAATNAGVDTSASSSAKLAQEFQIVIAEKFQLGDPNWIGKIEWKVAGEKGLESHRKLETVEEAFETMKNIPPKTDNEMVESRMMDNEILKRLLAEKQQLTELEFEVNIPGDWFSIQKKQMENAVRSIESRIKTQLQLAESPKIEVTKFYSSIGNSVSEIEEIGNPKKVTCCEGDDTVESSFFDLKSTKSIVFLVSLCMLCIAVVVYIYKKRKEASSKKEVLKELEDEVIEIILPELSTTSSVTNALDLLNKDIDLYDPEEAFRQEQKRRWQAFFENRNRFVKKGYCVFCGGERLVQYHNLKSAFAKPDDPNNNFECCSECYPWFFGHTENPEEHYANGKDPDDGNNPLEDHYSNAEFNDCKGELNDQEAIETAGIELQSFPPTLLAIDELAINDNNINAVNENIDRHLKNHDEKIKAENSATSTEIPASLFRNSTATKSMAHSATTGTPMGPNATQQDSPAGSLFRNSMYRERSSQMEWTGGNSPSAESWGQVPGETWESLDGENINLGVINEVYGEEGGDLAYDKHSVHEYGQEYGDNGENENGYPEEPTAGMESYDTATGYYDETTGVWHQQKYPEGETEEYGEELQEYAEDQEYTPEEYPEGETQEYGEELQEYAEDQEYTREEYPEGEFPDGHILKEYTEADGEVEYDENGDEIYNANVGYTSQDQTDENGQYKDPNNPVANGPEHYYIGGDSTDKSQTQSVERLYDTYTDFYGESRADCMGYPSLVSPNTGAQFSLNSMIDQSSPSNRVTGETGNTNSLSSNPMSGVEKGVTEASERGENERASEKKEDRGKRHKSSKRSKSHKDDRDLDRDKKDRDSKDTKESRDKDVDRERKDRSRHREKKDSKDKKDRDRSRDRREESKDKKDRSRKDRYDDRKEDKKRERKDDRDRTKSEARSEAKSVARSESKTEASRDRDKERGRDKGRDKDRERSKDRDREKSRSKDRDRDKDRDRKDKKSRS